MKTYSIKDLENYSGVKAHTIRIWEQRYNLLNPDRTDTGIRFYNSDELKKILHTSSLLKAGFKISKIASYSKEKMNQEIAIIDSQLEISDSKTELSIQTLLTNGLDFNGVELEKEYTKLKSQYDFFDLITKIIYPIINRLGIMWNKDDLTPLQEHFISIFFRQKILVEIDQIELPVNKNYDIVLFLPEDESHELGLFVAHYLLKKNGVNVLYLGQKVPISNLSNLIKELKIKSALGFIFISNGIENLDKMFVKLSKKCPQTDFYWGGSVAILEATKLPSKHTILTNIDDFKSKLIH